MSRWIRCSIVIVLRINAALPYKIRVVSKINIRDTTNIAGFCPNVYGKPPNWRRRHHNRHSRCCGYRYQGWRLGDFTPIGKQPRIVHSSARIPYKLRHLCSHIHSNGYTFFFTSIFPLGQIIEQRPNMALRRLLCCLISCPCQVPRIHKFIPQLNRSLRRVRNQLGSALLIGYQRIYWNFVGSEVAPWGW